MVKLLTLLHLSSKVKLPWDLFFGEERDEVRKFEFLVPFIPRCQVMILSEGLKIFVLTSWKDFMVGVSKIVRRLGYLTNLLC